MPVNTKKDLTGMRFGKLVALESVGSGYWNCICDCGKQRHFQTYQLNAGNNRSCGCLNPHHRKREKHGLAATDEYQIWQAIKSRCLYPSNKKYANYGGRGITICDEWKDSFLAFFTAVGPRPNHHWIERKDGNKGYEPGNVIWATPLQQQRNRSNNHLYEIHGQRMTLRECVERFGAPEISFYTARSRLRYGWTLEEALTEPLRQNA